jgi:spore germination cell wall hydrolase CwlJ-like protein
MNKIAWLGTGTAVALFWFQQQEIQMVHNDVQEIKSLIVQTNQKVNYSQQDLQCLSKNIYHEAGIEAPEGMFAVAQVTLNRLHSGRWGKSICDVVYSKAQFSWTLYPKIRNEKPKGELWERSQFVARSVLEQGYRVPQLENAILYHADYVNPYWAKAVVKMQQIGRHIFYKTS